MDKDQKLKEAQVILKEMEVPEAQQNEISAYTLLALASIKPDDQWFNATKESKTISNDIMAFVDRFYERTYKPNTRETFRRQVLHQFVQAGIALHNPDAPHLPINSPKNHYALSQHALDTIKTFGSENWPNQLLKFHDQQKSLAELYRQERMQQRIPITINDEIELMLSSGEHNLVEKAVIEDFTARFAQGSKVLYVGDTADKEFWINKAQLSKLNIDIDKHTKLPDVVLFDKQKNWLFLVEAVTSHGPISPKRVLELEEILKYCSAIPIYVTAFPDRKTFRKYAADIAWETEVWILDQPEHMIHFNGDKFLGPHIK